MTRAMTFSKRCSINVFVYLTYFYNVHDLYFILYGLSRCKYLFSAYNLATLQIVYNNQFHVL